MEKNYESIDYQIGALMGELIWQRMGFIDVYGDDGPEVILRYNKNPMTKEDADRLKAANDAYYTEKDRKKREELWYEYNRIHSELEDKYLPNPVTYRNYMFDLSHIKNMKDFKDGIIGYLWNTDFCPYSIKDEDIKIEFTETEFSRSTEFTFILDKTIPKYI
jgi:hypothetical protein